MNVNLLFPGCYIHLRKHFILINLFYGSHYKNATLKMLHPGE